MVLWNVDSEQKCYSHTVPLKINLKENLNPSILRRECKIGVNALTQAWAHVHNFMVGIVGGRKCRIRYREKSDVWSQGGQKVVMEPISSSREVLLEEQCELNSSISVRRRSSPNDTQWPLRCVYLVDGACLQNCLKRTYPFRNRWRVQRVLIGSTGLQVSIVETVCTSTRAPEPWTDLYIAEKELKILMPPTGMMWMSEITMIPYASGIEICLLATTDHQSTIVEYWPSSWMLN